MSKKSEEVKERLLDYMNTEFVDDPPFEDIPAGEVMQDPANIAYSEKINSAYGLADELLTPDGETLWWDDDVRRWSIRPVEDES